MGREERSCYIGNGEREERGCMQLIICNNEHVSKPHIVVQHLVHTHTHTYMHTYLHTCTHTYIQAVIYTGRQTD